MTLFLPIKALVALLVILGVACSLLFSLLVTSPSMAATAKRAPAVRDCPSSKATMRPNRLLLACADGNEYMSHLKWKSWTTTKAVGTGTLYLNDCNPDCASGHFRSYKANITLSSVRPILGLRLYTKYQLVWSSHGKKHVEKGMPISQ